MRFEWDLAKARANERKHAVSFEEAVSVFRGFCVYEPDTRRDYGEVRFVALGRYINDSGAQRGLHVARGDGIRIISAWKASRDERENYAKAQPDRAL